MKELIRLLTALVLTIFFFGQSFHLQAITINSSPPPSTSPDLLITSLISLDGALPDYIEVFNQSASPINLAGFSFNFTESGSGCDGLKVNPQLSNLSGWILSKKYLTLQRVTNASQAGEFSIDPDQTATCTNPWMSSMELIESGDTGQLLEITDSSSLTPTVNTSTSPATITYNVAQHHQRNNSINSARTLSGNFDTDYNISAVGASTELYSDPIYVPPGSTAGLEIVELLPHAQNCSPTDTSLTCNDYIKLFNTSKNSIDLSSYRLRTSYGGNKSTASNTVSLTGSLAGGGYVLINTKNDGSALGLTESGGYVWLEDAYGAKIYTPVVEYPDASATNKTGWAWALNRNTWRWSTSPQPTGPNIFPSGDIAILSLSTSNLPNPCAPGQFRNPATNRCKTIATTASLSSSLKLCPVGQERNPATNRCRKSGSVLGASTLNVADIAAPQIANSTQWALAGSAVALALGYAAFEWRQEILLGLSDSRSKLLLALKNFRN